MNDKRPEQTLSAILDRLERPKKAVVTAGMPYANGPLHLGHLAGAHVPADIYSRWLGMLIGRENVLFVCGTDDHGSNSEVAAKKEGVSVQQFIEKVHAGQTETMSSYNIGLDVYTGTSRPENMEFHQEYCQNFLRELMANKMLDKKTSMQWFDPKMDMFLPDRFVFGTCPNENCSNEKAYSDECDACGSQHEPKDLINPKSTVSDACPVLKPTDHWWLNMWKVSDTLKQWIEGKKKTWNKMVINETYNTVLPSLSFSNKFEPTYKELKSTLPTHKSRYAPGKKVVAQFESLKDLEKATLVLKDKGIESELVDGWAHRSITRDVSWGVPVPADIDPTMKDKTLYVWPESLIAPISFTKLALKKQGKNPEEFEKFWKDPEAKVYQFLGIDNVYFYVLMQGAMWLGTQKDSHRLPVKGELQMTDIFSVYHLQVEGAKMSKSTGNYYTADDLIKEKGYTADQVRYYLSLLGLTSKASNFDFDTFQKRNEFLAGPMNASFEKPISACHKQFSGKVPEGKLFEKTTAETFKIARIYLNAMSKGEYGKLLFAVENYARLINSYFTQYKPHDDRQDLVSRSEALFNCFYILKNTMIMLYPFVPETMNKLRVSLNLAESIFNIDELKNELKAGHEIGEQTDYFPVFNLLP
jgi:methionyl-tRNA synthetase